MDHRWLAGLKGEDKEVKKKQIIALKTQLNEIADILEEFFEENTPDYDSPSWAYHQADHNGANRKLHEIIKLLRIKD